MTTTVLLLGWTSLGPPMAMAQATTSPPKENTARRPVGVLSRELLNDIAARIDQAIAEKKLPGCVINFGTSEGTAYCQAYGNKWIEPQIVPMSTDTIFDLASLTKPIATATSIMILVDREQLDLDAKVADYLPEFGKHGKEDISVRQLLIHQSGLIPDNPLSDYLDGPIRAWEHICELKLTAPVGTKFQYSDVNFIVLGELIARVSGEALDVFSRRAIFEPLGMSETMFCPWESLAERCAPTEQRDGRWLQGQVHDPRSHWLGGVAGHAGLFSTGEDIAKYARWMLRLNRSSDEIHSQPELTEILSPKAARVMTQAYPVSGGMRGLGWDKQTGFSTNRGKKLSPSAFGHGGFTGTVLWIDPDCDFYFVFLSNRLHPLGQGNINPLSGELLDLIAPKFCSTKSNLRVDQR